jgi:hypothetical protein
MRRRERRPRCVAQRQGRCYASRVDCFGHARQYVVTGVVMCEKFDDFCSDAVRVPVRVSRPRYIPRAKPTWREEVGYVLVLGKVRGLACLCPVWWMGTPYVISEAGAVGAFSSVFGISRPGVEARGGLRPSVLLDRTSCSSGRLVGG